jgi:hypothetical protein
MHDVPAVFNSDLPVVICSNPPLSVHIAAASYGSQSRPFGRWYLNYQAQETFTATGLYVVTLWLSNGVLQQVSNCLSSLCCNFGLSLQRQLGDQLQLYLTALARKALPVEHVAGTGSLPKATVLRYYDSTM